MPPQYTLSVRSPDGVLWQVRRQKICPIALCAEGKAGWAVVYWATTQDDAERRRERLKDEYAAQGKKIIAWTTLRTTVEPCIRGGRLGIRGLRWVSGAYR